MSLWGAAVNSITATDTSILVSGTPANPTIAVGVSAMRLNPTSVQTNNYTASPNDLVLVDTTSRNVTVAFPTAPADKTVVGVKQVVRPGTNTVSVALGGSDVFNVASGSNTATIVLLNQAAVFQYVATSAVWVTMSTDAPLSQLDARYATPSFATSRAVALAVVLGS